jgi:putative radical SAM enzyme (TIGR03279 family)
MKVISVDPQSPLCGLIRAGYKLLGIDGEPVKDNIDYRYKVAEEAVRLEFADLKGERFAFRVRFETVSDLGLIFEEDKILTCRNKCLFCFVHQQPKGMRRALYIKDDDYRLSFTHGNFISLSNLTGDDMERIIEQRLSPLYVSVHTTDDRLRRHLFGNRGLPPIMSQLQYLTAKGITIHAQVVICPGINDGEILDKTIDELFSLFPGVMTLGVVPVGLTKYRDKLPALRPFDGEMAENLINYIHFRQKDFLAKSGSRFVFGADELYILAEREFPKLQEYEEMAQFENGIGMMRLFLSDFSRRKRYLRSAKRKMCLAFLTGESAFGAIYCHIIPELRHRGIKADFYRVINRFWGSSVTVSGLLTGRDLLGEIKGLPKKYNAVILPPNCLNSDGLFLDDMSLESLRRKAGFDVQVGKYSMIDTINGVLN